MPPSIPRKTGVIVCHHCALPIRDEYVRLVHGSRGQREPDVELYFCNADCHDEHFWQERHASKVDQEVQKEKNEIYKQVCPACRRRLT